MSEVQEVFNGQFTDILVVTELRGGYPNVPISSDVDYNDLIQNDPNPMFLTLPVAKANSTSSNKRFYDNAFVDELLRQTLLNKPIGLLGHLSESERATAFPLEALHWVGALREGEFIWGKAYVVPGQTRERIARYKASGKSIATSIDAIASGDWDETIKAFRMNAKSLKLGQIDLAPSDRAGIAALARVPMLTTELQTTDKQGVKKVTKTEVLQELNQLEASDHKFLPELVIQAVIAAQPKTITEIAPEIATVKELCETLSVDPQKLLETVQAMKTQQEQTANAAVQSKITELVNAGIAVETVRPIITELVQAQKPDSVESVQAAYDKIIAQPSVKKLLAAQIVETMGAKQTAGNVGTAKKNNFFVIPTA